MRSKKPTIQKFIANVTLGYGNLWKLDGQKAFAKDMYGNKLLLISKTPFNPSWFKRYVFGTMQDKEKPTNPQAFDIPIKAQKAVKDNSTKNLGAFIHSNGIVGTDGHQMLFIPTGYITNPIDIKLHQAVLGLSQTFELTAIEQDKEVWYSIPEFDVCITFESMYTPDVDGINPLHIQQFVQHKKEIEIPNNPTCATINDGLPLCRFHNEELDQTGFYAWNLVHKYTGQKAFFLDGWSPLYVTLPNNAYALIMSFRERDDHVVNI